MELQKSHRVLNTVACIYSMLVLDFYNSRIIYAMVNKVRNRPFDDLVTLRNRTNFVVLGETDSVVHLTYDYLQHYKVCNCHG